MRAVVTVIDPPRPRRTLGMTTLVYGPVRSADVGRADPVAVPALGVGVVLLAGFVVNEWWGRAAKSCRCACSPTGPASPGAHAAWHCHANGQTLHVTDGLGLVQARYGEIIEIHAGDTIVTPPGEWHWHGAAPQNFMTHLAMWESLADGQQGPEPRGASTSSRNTPPTDHARL
jgi:hypothetical protein